MQQPQNQPPQYPTQWNNSGQQQPYYPPQQPYYPQQQQPMPPQQPYYPQQQQPVFQQPKKKVKGCLAASIAALVVGIVIFAIAMHSSPSTTTGATTTTTSQNSQGQATSAPTSVQHGVGSSQTVENWTVTLNSVKTSATSTDLAQLKAGDMFLLVDVSVANNTGQSQTLSSILQFSLKDNTGQVYNDTLGSTSTASPDGTIANGSKLRGTIGYEVPKNAAQPYELDFVPGLGSTDQVSWSFSA